MDEKERNDLIEQCAKAGEAAVNQARQEGETDLRSVRVWVTVAIRELKR